MTKLKKLSVVLLVLLCALVAIVPLATKGYAKADENYEAELAVEEVSANVEPRGLYTSLSISLNGGNGKIWATAKNEITIFPSTVYVIVQLYSSYSYCEDYREMTLVSTNTISDLDMGKTLVTEASTNGEEKFWMGRVRYRVDNGDWKDKTVGALRYSANGECLGAI